MLQNKSQMVSHPTRAKFAALNACLISLTFLIYWLVLPDRNFPNIYAEINDSLERMQAIENISDLRIFDLLITIPLVEFRFLFFGILATSGVFFSAFLLAPKYFSSKNLVTRFLTYLGGFALSIFFFTCLFSISVAVQPILSGCRTSSGQGWVHELYKGGCMAELDPISAFLFPWLIVPVQPITWIAFAICALTFCLKRPQSKSQIGT